MANLTGSTHRSLYRYHVALAQTIGCEWGGVSFSDAHGYRLWHLEHFISIIFNKNT